MVVLEGENWFYFATKCTTAVEAFKDFAQAMNIAHINDDNVHYKKAVLRDENDNVIDEI